MPPMLSRLSRTFVPFQGRRLCARPTQCRRYTILAIETSCDDTSVAILSRQPTVGSTSLLFHETLTSNNHAFAGVHPLLSIESHRRNLPVLLRRAIPHLPSGRPDVVAATRGPGMRGCLSVGMDVASGLVSAWGPGGTRFVQVHHMLAHLLTPRLVAALENGGREKEHSPEFPFLTLLVSGGHTMLLESRGLGEHSILADTVDVAVGDYIDKCARALLDTSWRTRLSSPSSSDSDADPAKAIPQKHIPYGKRLEDYAFPNGASDYNYTPSSDPQQIYVAGAEPYDLALPLSQKPRHKSLRAFSFAGLGSRVERLVRESKDMSDSERRTLARLVQTVAFEHLASRVVRSLGDLGPERAGKLNALVVSGGVASNGFLRHLLRTYLDAAGYAGLRLEFPPVRLCVDNAAMIAWAGSEVWEAGWESEVGLTPIRKWLLEAGESDGEKGEEDVGRGVWGVDGWRRREGW